MDAPAARPVGHHAGVSEPQDAFTRLAWPVQTERLLLRPLEPGDAPAAHAFRTRPEVDRWMGGRPGDGEEFAAWFTRPERAAKTLVVLHDDRLVGDLMLAVGDGWSQVDVADAAAGTEAELGWCFDPAYGGRGLATEAVRALLAICFDPQTGLGLRRVTAGCFAGNAPSWRLMERVGMRREAHGVADALHRDLGWVDGYTYALLASEWRAAAGGGSRRVGA